MKSKLSYVWLALGTLLLVFANGKWIVPLAAWLAPVFIMRFTRAQKPLLGSVLSLLAYTVAFIIAWRGLIPMEGIFYYLIAGGTGFIFWLPYLADRLIAPHLKGLWSTLAFPLTWTTLEYISTLTNPFPTWGSWAYTQYGNLPLVQIVSVTGIWGLIFLVSWLATVVNWAWEQAFAWPQIRKGAMVYGTILAMTLLLGGLRLTAFSPNANTVQVASVITTPANKSLWTKALTNPHPSSDSYLQILDDYIERSRQQAWAGAKIVVWDESGIYVPAGEEDLVVERGRELAKQEDIYLLMGLFVQTEEDPEMFENKLVWIETDGDVAWEYLKSIIVPGDSQVAGDGQIPIQDTPYGKIGAVLCFDMDQPLLIRQVGKAGADILFAPSDDWRDVDPIHARMASFRAIENGISLVRPTSEGLSAAFDYQGRVLAATDYFTSDGETMIAHIPTQGVRTIYSMTGDLFAWLCVAGSVAVTGAAFWIKKRK
jgi:apolipoprotein N-acyltransferase